MSPDRFECVTPYREAEPEVIECPSCGRCTYAENLRKCEKCKLEICVSCPDARWIAEYGWHFCGTECAIAYLVDKIQDQDDELDELRKAGETCRIQKPIKDTD